MEAEGRAISEYSAGEKRALLARLLEKKARAPKRAPLSLGQERLWFIDQLTPGNPAYNMFTAVRLKGEFDVAVLEKSFNEIIRRHEILRTSFPSIDGAPVQLIEPALTLSLPLFDLSDLSEAEREAEVRRLAEEEAHRPFVLAEAPLLRASVIRLGEHEHVVLVTMHHIVSDGWSLDIFTRELSSLYEAFHKGQSSPLPELPLQYANFAHWQRQWLQGEVFESLLSYWKTKLAGIPLLLDLPTDHPRPQLQSFRGASRSLRIPDDLSAALKELNRREGVTMFMTLLSAFQILLYRYSGQDDINIGTPIAGRERLETESLMGFFLNTLVIRAKFTDGLTFREALRQTRESVLEAHEHQDMPFEKLVEALRPKRSLSYEPLVQVAFVFVVTPGNYANVSELRAENLSTRNDTAKFDLTLYIQETANAYTIDVQYSSDLFDDSTIARMLEHYEVLLRGIVSNPKQQVSKLPLLPEAEREQLLLEWNDTHGAYPTDQCIPELFQQQAARTPHAEALICNGDQLTYGELNRRANQLAHYLRTLGAGPEMLVGVMMERRLDLVVALLGILKAGAAYVPLDPAYPAERLRFMLDDTRAPVLLTQSTLVERLPSEHAAQVIRLDADWPHITAGMPDSDPDVLVQTENLAYVIYTSGSTGQPKGVMLTHGSAAQFVQWARSYFTAAELKLVVAATSVCFDLSVFELWVPLSSGGAVALVENALALPQLEGDVPVTLLNTVPSVIAELLRGGYRLPESVMTVNLAGEALSEQLVRTVYEAGNVEQVNDLYGPTEDTTYSTWTRRSGGERATIGRPIINKQVYILDDWQQPVPTGVRGELHLGGTGLARGYLNRPELTAERFIPNPFDSGDGSGRLYKTGDLARWLPDGNIEYLGRIDNQLKIRGYRIETGEIEISLNKHPNVRTSVVIARADGAGEKQLVAYCVPQGIGESEDSQLLPRKFKAYLKETLPEYMIPSFITIVDELPLTPNGKIDRKALPEPRQTEKERSYAAPRNSLESQLAWIWEELLGVSPIGIRESFFELGGHSLLAVRLMAQIRKRFGIDLPIAALFRGETIEELAKILSEQGTAWRSSPLVPIQPKGTKPRFFCVHALGGNVNNFYLLSRYLGSDQPFYGLQAPPLEDAAEEHTQIETMAARYVEAIREVQPAGPYLIGGYSFGCYVAYEMAKQLREQGQNISLLALFDTYSPLYWNKLPEKRDMADILVSLAWTTSREKGKQLLLPVDELRQLTFDEQLVYFLQKMRAEDLAPAEVDEELLRRFLKGVAGRQRAMHIYSPQPYPGRVTLFKCNERDQLWNERLLAVGLDPYDESLGWQGLSPEPVTVIEIPGHHDVICQDPYVQSLAELLRACIDEAATPASQEQAASLSFNTV